MEDFFDRVLAELRGKDGDRVLVLLVILAGGEGFITERAEC